MSQTTVSRFFSRFRNVLFPGPGQPGGHRQPPVYHVTTHRVAGYFPETGRQLVFVQSRYTCRRPE